MREIKFRAWDGNKIIGTYNDRQTFALDFSGNLFSYGHGNAPFPHYVQEDLVLMQLTGLRDKNGTPIYEDDIVKTENGIYQVSWNQLHCAWCLFGLHGGMEREIIADWITDEGKTPKRWEKSQWEVIGNVFENPELLK